MLRFSHPKLMVVRVKRRGIRLRYHFDAEEVQRGAQIENPLFDLLSSMHTHGSIRHSALASGRSYRFIWGELKAWEAVLGAPLVEWAQGKRALLTPFALRLLWAERQARVRMTPHIEALRSELEHVLAQAYDSRNEVLEVLASHDVALSRLQALAAQGQHLHLVLRFVGSQDALRSLLEGRCTVAGFHVPRLDGLSPVFAKALRPLLEPGRHKLIGSHRRRQGFMVRRDAAAPRDLRDVAEGGLRFANRQEGSGTRLLADHLVQAARLKPTQIDGYQTRIEHTHVAVAATIAAGAADVGIGVEAAAHEMGLAFVPLVEEDYYLVCLKRELDRPAVTMLRECLASPGWKVALSSLPGYAPQYSGEVLSLTRALPWWRELKPKGATATRA